MTDTKVPEPTKLTVVNDRTRLFIAIAVLLGIVAVNLWTRTRPQGRHSSGVTERVDRLISDARAKVRKNEIRPQLFVQQLEKLESDIDLSNGKQLVAFAGLLQDVWQTTPIEEGEIRKILRVKGDIALKKAESLGRLNAYLNDGFWCGQAEEIKLSMMLDNNDPRSSTWPILATSDKWVEGAMKGSPICQFMIERIAPQWRNAEGVLGEYEALYEKIQARIRSGYSGSSAEFALLDDLRIRWITQSGMISAHAVDHPDHALPCFGWFKDKMGENLTEWNQAHRQP